MGFVKISHVTLIVAEDPRFPGQLLLMAQRHELILILVFLPAALRAAQTCRYFVYSEANFEVLFVGFQWAKTTILDKF